YEITNSHPGSRFEYDYSGLDTSLTYVYSVLTSLPVITNTIHLNTNEINHETLQVSDSLYLHYVSFVPTDASGSGKLRQYYGERPLGSTFRLYYAQLQEGDFPTMWHPAEQDIISEI